MACRGSFSLLTVGIDHPAQEDVEAVGELRRATPLRPADGVESVHLLAPSSPWSPASSSAPLRLDESTEYLVGASDRNSTVATGGVAFDLDAVAGLPSGRVMASVDGKTHRLGLREFESPGCDR